MGSMSVFAVASAPYAHPIVSNDCQLRSSVQLKPSTSKAIEEMLKEIPEIISCKERLFVDNTTCQIESSVIPKFATDLPHGNLVKRSQ